MPISLRIPSGKEKIINRAASKAGKTKTAYVLEAVYEKLGLTKEREQIIGNVQKLWHRVFLNKQLRDRDNRFSSASNAFQ